MSEQTMLVVQTPWGAFKIDPRIPAVFKRLMCSREACGNMAGQVWWHGDGKLSDKQYCRQHWDEEYQKTVLEEMRSKRREAVKT